MATVLDKTFRKIDEFLNLEPDEIKKSSELGKDISENAAELKFLIRGEEIKEEYSGILSKLNEYSSKLLTDFLKSTEGSLSTDWRQIAKQDQLKLKDQVSIFQRFLETHKEVLRRRAYEEKFGLDIQELAIRLEKEDYLDEFLSRRLLKMFKDMDEIEKQNKVEKHSVRLSRISNWFLKLKEVDNVKR